MHEGIAILCCRRSGASGLAALLSDALKPRQLAADPFAATGAWADIAHAFHAGRAPAAREALRAALDGKGFFRHSLDTETPEFNRLLVDALAATPYRCIVLTRTLDTACIFSRMVASHFGVRGREQIQALRQRLMSASHLPPWGEREVQAFVREQWARHFAFEQDLAPLAAQRFTVGFEPLLRDGIGALDVLDRLFGFLELGDRITLLADDTVLQAIRAGEQHTHSLRTVAAALERLWMQISDELSRLAAIAQRPAGDGVRI